MCSNYVTDTHWISVHLLTNNVVFEFKKLFYNRPNLSDVLHRESKKETLYSCPYLC